MTSETDCIKVKTVDKTFTIGGKPFYALSQVSLNFKHGEFSGLVGPSGSGKTTLLNLIGALDQATSGSVEVLGHKTDTLSSQRAAALRAQEIGFVFQHYQLFPVYSIFENVSFPLLLLGKKSKTDVQDALEWVGLSDRANSRPSQLSGGQCQRVAIARAIVKRPKLIIADEPTANLDAENSHKILQTMVKLNQELNTTFIFSTHDAKVIKYLKRIIHLEDGKVAKDENALS